MSSLLTEMLRRGKVYAPVKRIVLTVVAILVFARAMSVCAQTNFESLNQWVGKYPVTLKSKPRESIYKSPVLRPSLLKLLGRKLYYRLANDYYVMSPIKSVDGYLITQMCVQHFCPSSSSVMAVNLKAGDIHVGFYYYGEATWYHTKGKLRDLPSNVFQDVWWMQSTDAIKPISRKREITRN